MMKQNSLLLPIGLISTACFAFFVLWLWLPVSEVLESKAFDYVQRVRYLLHGPVFASDQMGLIIIDDQSVDPGYSSFSDPWGSGRWRTREQYTQQMSILMTGFKPAVLAYDLLFPPGVAPTTDERAEKLARAQQMRSQTGDILKTLYEVEMDGINAIQSELFSMQELRENRELAPFPVFAYVFPVDEKSKQLARTSIEQRKQQYAALEGEIFPPGLIQGKMTGHKVVNLPAEEIRLARPGLGSINVMPDSGGVVRRVPLLYPVEDPDTLETRYVAGFALRILLAYWNISPGELHAPGHGLPSLSAVAGKEILLETKSWKKRIPIDEKFRLRLNVRCRFPDTNAKPFVDVTRYGMELVAGMESSGVSVPELKDRIDKAKEINAYLNGKIAVVAQAFTGSGDIGNFPLEENTPNAMAHFYAMDNLLRDDYFRDSSFALELVICFVFSAIAVACYTIVGTFRANIILVSCLGLYPFLVLFSAERFTQVLPIISPLLLLGTLLAFNNFYVYLTEEKEKRQMRKMFSTMVSPRVLQLMDENPEEFALRGKKAEATIFFSDLAGFTSISEKISAEELSSLLNRYFTATTDIILETDGYLDKYSGDGIMAVWGVPYPDAEHAVKACKAALRQQELILVLAEEIRKELGIVISVRMGINSGQVSAGNMGSEKRFQYTVMGDAVNLAARLEPVNKDYGTSIIIGQETRKLLEGAPLLLRCLDKMVVKGKTEPVLIHELVKEATPGQEAPEWVRAYEKGLNHLWAREWDEAEKKFRSCVELCGDTAAKLMLDRVSFYRVNPPPQGWSGAFVRASKD